jgi:hypothetical protein
VIINDLAWFSFDGKPDARFCTVLAMLIVVAEVVAALNAFFLPKKSRSQRNLKISLSILLLLS